MRADRLVSILLLLQIYQHMTARQLAERLEVSERTILRDMEALSTAGIPVYAERGVGGGWSLVEGYTTNLTGLNESEIQALFLTRPPKLLADLGLDKASDAALIKLFAAIPSTSRTGADYARQRMHIDVTGWNRPEEASPLLSSIQDAVWRERKMYMTYRRGECESIERLVDPLGLVAKGSVWYLVAAADVDIRSYRISRIQDVRVTDESVTRPAAFDLVEFWEKSSVEFRKQLPRYNTTIRVSSQVAHLLQYLGMFSKVEQMNAPDDDGYRTVVMRFQFEHEAAQCLIRLGKHV